MKGGRMETSIAAQAGGHGGRNTCGRLWGTLIGDR